MNYSTTQGKTDMTATAPIQTKSPLKVALEALELAAEFGGELDLECYQEAKNNLQALVDEITAHDRQMAIDERITEPQDYEDLIELLGLREPESPTSA